MARVKSMEKWIIVVLALLVIYNLWQIYALRKEIASLKAGVLQMAVGERPPFEEWELLSGEAGDHFKQAWKHLINGDRARMGAELDVAAAYAHDAIDHGTAPSREKAGRVGSWWQRTGEKFQRVREAWKSGSNKR